MKSIRLSVPKATFDRPAPGGTADMLDPHGITQVLGTILPSIALETARQLAPAAHLSVMVTGPDGAVAAAVRGHREDGRGATRRGPASSPAAPWTPPA